MTKIPPSPPLSKGGEVKEVLAGPEYFDCGPLKARISARQCLLNQGKAHGLKVFGTRYMGREAVCLGCGEGRLMEAFPPGVFQVPGSEPPPQKNRPKRLPAWLKNASAAVRRDYLKAQERGHE